MNRRPLSPFSTHHSTLVCAYLIAHATGHAFSGVDKLTGTPCFVMELSAARKLITKLERQLQVDLSGAVALIEAGLRHQPPKYDALQPVNVVNEQQYRQATNSFGKLARQTKGQVSSGAGAEGRCKQTGRGQQHTQLQMEAKKASSARARGMFRRSGCRLIGWHCLSSWLRPRPGWAAQQQQLARLQQWCRRSQGGSERGNQLKLCRVGLIQALHCCAAVQW